MRAPATRYSYFAASAVLGALSLLTIYYAERWRPLHPEVVYTVKPLPATGRVQVRMELSHLPPGRLLLLAPETELSPEAGPPAAPDFGRYEGVLVGPRLWWGMTDARGHLSLSYEVAPRTIDSGHALLFGSRTFAVPLRSDPRAALFDRDALGHPVDRHPAGAAARLAVRFDLPSGWDAYTPWGESAPTVQVPGGRFARLRESIVALGDYVPHGFEAGGARVELVSRGTDPAREDELVRLVRDCLAAHARAVGPSVHRRLLVVADHPFRGDQAAGQAVQNAAHLELSRDPDALQTRSLGRVVAHELFHLWNGGAIDLDAPELRWFAEGVTEYYALRALAVTGRMPAGGLANELAASFDRLRGNPWADSTLAALGRGYPDRPLAWSATYAKGALAAWAIDLRLGGSGGLDAVMRSLLRAGGKPDFALVPELAPGTPAGELLGPASRSGRSLRQALGRDLATQGMRLTQRRSRNLTLGLRFFRPGTTEVIDLDPYGPAALRGLRRGDRVVAVDGRPVDDLAVLAERLADARGGAVRMRVARRGRVLDLEIPPRQAVVTEVVGTSPSVKMATRLPAPGELAP